MSKRIKELAEQAEITLSERDGWWVAYDEDLERFAELVRQDYANQFITDAERDENIRSEERRHVAEHYLSIMRDAVAQAVKREREACAKLCDDWLVGRDDICEVAKAIRGRTE
jgi:hypothetical protein